MTPMSSIDTEQRVLNESWRATPDTMMAELTNGLQYPPPHLQLLGHLFWLAMTGAIPKLSISVPPGHAKSQLARWSCAWALDQTPSTKIIYACYGKALAEEAGKYVRGVLTEHESRLRVRLKKDSQASDRWQTTANGGMWSAGIRSGVTGRRANCVAEGTLITTETGAIKVEDLIRLPQPPRVLTFNHSTNTTEWADVLASQVSESDSLVELQSDRGTTLRCTPDHRVYDVERGYREARDFDQQGMCYTRAGPVTLSVTKSLHGDRYRVYDLQLAPNSNFFANGILVHNCIIIDDPHKDWAEATSEYFTSNIWDVYQSVLRTRMVPNSNQVVIATRWSHHDLIGRLQAAQSKQWCHVRLPAIAEEDETIETVLGARTVRRLQKQGIVLPEWHREEGETLWPLNLNVDRGAWEPYYDEKTCWASRMM